MIKQLIFGDATKELESTRRILERLPEEYMSWKPHDKSMTLEGLATHLINLLNWQIAIFQYPEFDLATVQQRRQPLKTRADILEEFDANVSKLGKLLDECDEKMLDQEWTLRHGDHIVLREPRAIALRTFGLSHMIHHRAQIGVYFRLLDIPVPGIYGPSADEEVQ
ncbi:MULTISPECIES: DinB family protein [Bacillus cereus group]|uniref:Damage-inducible protein DinB n=1 Tax=Bacillus cereus TaxID=1396 RepID=A0AA44TCH4_BACCE|nr:MULTISPECIES: DinB family protein [Bacillus cereus group]PFA14211.1 damage-inducible protein DinB [Bacillus cereus]PFN02668.1 damage-inducible protein DinB [Bacillus cereus]PFO77106.1 damage-inducible protein DinB [Bacillus cereus]PFR20562.1 damage-inducible protein DinB [Bacillus cereus]PFR90892.1 damage-inducible protein DinB [Bacillus cereus]